MEEKKTDIRIVKTRRAIQAAFLELMKEKGFAAVTVKDIIQEAEINRSTFYAHYEDKYDLLENIENDLLIRINEPEIKGDVFLSGKDSEAFEEIIRSRAQMLIENGQLLALLFSENGDPAFAGKLGDSIYQLWRSAEVSGRFILPDQYAMAVLIGILTGLFSEWIRGVFKESADEFSSLVVTTVRTFQKTMLIR